MSNAAKKSLEPKIVYQDDQIFLVNKPGGWVTLKVKTYDGCTLQEWVDKNVREARKVRKVRSGIVHRLDKDTWGLVLGAKNKPAFDFLQNQFKKRKVKKEYWALVHGNLRSRGEVVSPIGRLAYNRFKYGVQPDGKSAQTKFEPGGNYKIGDDLYTLVKVWPKTGRTHQIRVHLKYLGHPIYGDSLYGIDEDESRPMFLVAKKISFLHPKTQKKVRFKIDLPEAIKNIIENAKETEK